MFASLFSLDLLRDAWIKRVIYLDAPFSAEVFARVWTGHFLHALQAVLVLLGAWGWGGVFVRATGRRADGLTALGLGFAASGVGLLAAGLCGLYHPVWSASWCAAGACLAIRRERRMLAGAWVGARAALAPGSHEARRLAWVVGVMGVVCLVMALGPEGGWDPVYYHLRLPKLYAMSHKTTFVPWIFPSHYPQGIEMLYGLAWLLGGEGPARLVNWSFWGWAGLALARLARREDGRTRMRAVALALTMPLVGTLACENYIDLGLTFLETLALSAALDGRLLASGLLAGAAMGSKYTAVVAAAATAAALLAARTPLRRRARWAAAAILPVLPWLGKNWLLTGDPVAPLLWRRLGGLEWAGGVDQSVMAAVIPHHLTASAPARAARELLLGFWEFARRTSFAVFNPVPLALLPALAWRWEGRLKFLRDYVLTYTVAMLLLAPDGRYWQPAVFPLCLLAAAAWERLEAAGPRAPAAVIRWLGGASVACGVSYHALDMHRMFTSTWAALGLEEPRRQMIRTLVPVPWYTPAVEVANLSTPPRRRIAVISDVQAYQLDRDAIFDCDQPGTRRWVYNLAHRRPDEAAYRRQFRQWNVTTVLYVRGKAVGAARGERWSPDAVRAWTRFWNAGARLREPLGDCAVYEVGPPGPPRIQYDVPGVQESLLWGVLEDHLSAAERRRRFDGARRAAESAYLHGVYGERAAEEGERAAGIAEMKRAADLEPRAADVWFSLAMALARAGRVAEARAAFDRGRTLCPWAPDVPVVQRELAAAAGKTSARVGH